MKIQYGVRDSSHFVKQARAGIFPHVGYRSDVLTVSNDKNFTYKYFVIGNNYLQQNK